MVLGTSGWFGRLTIGEAGNGTLGVMIIPVA